MCETIVIRSFSIALRAFAVSEEPLNHMVFVTIRRLLVITPCLITIKFSECSGVALQNKSPSELRPTTNKVAA